MLHWFASDSSLTTKHENVFLWRIKFGFIKVRCDLSRFSNQGLVVESALIILMTLTRFANFISGTSLIVFVLDKIREF